MAADRERLKQRLPLLAYLGRHNWIARPAGTPQEFVGLCPLHRKAALPSMSTLGYSFDLALDIGLINHQGRDAFCRHVVFPCRRYGQIINLYGRSIGTAFPIPY